MSVLDLVRADLRDFAGYGSARKTGLVGRVWLNANESPWASPADPGQGLNRYPEPQPAALRARLAALHGVAEDTLLMTRGSDEGIDLLTRALCRAGHDAVLVSSPVFGMYAVCAKVQGAALVDVPLVDSGSAFRIDVDAMLAAFERSGPRVKIVYVCAPANPTGVAPSLADIERLLAGVAGRALVVVDEAYGEYMGRESALALRPRYPNLAVLRTLSKAYALAGARLGITMADAALIRVLNAISPPYPLAQPAAVLALSAMSEPAVAEAHERCALIIAERSRVAARLADAAGVRAVYASDANYLLVRFVDAEGTFRRLLAAGVVVRDQRAQPALSDALRITIGAPDENDALLEALAESHPANRTAPA